jgi:outer membrane receptor for ferrienterochelin and colicins
MPLERAFFRILAAVYLLHLFCQMPVVAAQERTSVQFAPTAQSELGEIVVSGGRAGRLKQAEIQRVDSLRPKDLERKQAQTFSQAIDDERGVDTQSACAFCGAKRITINGMRGEHTTILVDGLSLHSTVSSFYGVDAIPLGGIDSIDIYRGSGAALSAPESIGGAINILTKDIVANEREVNVSVAHDGQKNSSAVVAQKLGSNFGLLLGAQLGEIVPIDLDHNGISEQPRQTTKSFLGKLTQKWSENFHSSLRLSLAQLDTIGGALDKIRLDKPYGPAAPEDFTNKDVRQKYIGDTRKITDNVKLDRMEAATIHQLRLSADSDVKLSLGGAYQKQQAIYNHGYDYDNLDRLWVGVLEYNRALNDSHFLKIGVDHKDQFMNSDSRELYQKNRLQQDDLRNQNTSLYIQDTWLVSDATELSLALRLDHVRVEWLDLKQKLERSIVAPRLFLKHSHNSVLTSRFAYGLGYRAPLTLFESQHGLDHKGFVVNITEMERAHSFLYSLAGQRLNDFFEVSAHLTRLQNMAYGLDRSNLDLPTLFENAKDTYDVTVFDASYGRRIRPWWTVEAVAEMFNYPRGYKEKLVVAAVEKRLSVLSNLEWGQWTASQRLSVVGARDLSAYNYNRHYNIAYQDNDVSSPTFEQMTAIDQKRQTAPTYFTLDFTVQRRITQNIVLGAAVLNALDYTQTGAGDSPTMWHVHGQHSHLDNLHIWGPLRGRQFFVSLKGTF